MYRLILVLASFLCITRLSAQPPVHAYELNNSYEDTYGGTAMASNGGTLTSTSYVFQLGQGPSVSNVIDPYNYSIVMRFTPRHVDFWAKVLDFKNRTSDNGIYITDNRFMFYIGSPFMVAVGYDALFQDVPAVICLTRDGASKEVSGYVNGSLLWSFIDITDEASFTGPGNIIQIGIDDSPNEPIPGTEHADGALNYFRIYDYVVTDPAIIFPDCGIVDGDCDGTSNSCDICPGADDNGPCYVSVLPPLHTLPANWFCNNNNNSEKILICHRGVTMCVSKNAANTHLAHGDFLGPCISCPQNFAVIENEEKEADAMHSTDYNLSPNPSNEAFTFQWTKPTESLTTIRIMDASGRVLQSIASSDHEIYFGDQVAPGLYYAEITTGHDRKILKLLKTD